MKKLYLLLPLLLLSLACGTEKGPVTTTLTCNLEQEINDEEVGINTLNTTFVNSFTDDVLTKQDITIDIVYLQEEQYQEEKSNETASVATVNDTWVITNENYDDDELKISTTITKPFPSTEPDSEELLTPTTYDGMAQYMIALGYTCDNEVEPESSYFPTLENIKTTEEKTLIIYPSNYTYNNLTISNIKIDGIELTYSIEIDGEEETYTKLAIQLLNETGDILGYFPVYQNINEDDMTVTQYLNYPANQTKYYQFIILE